MLAGVLGACWLRNPHVPETPDRIECRCRRGRDLTRLHVEEEVPDSLTSLLLIGVELIERLKACEETCHHVRVEGTVASTRVPEPGLAARMNFPPTR
jgi:hypothetical protein